MTTRVWKSSQDLVQGPPADEFGPEVAAAIGELRRAHGIDAASCQPAGREDWRLLLPAVNRRGFLQLTGAAAVFALAGCGEKHPDTLVPWAQQPENTRSGEPVVYSSVVRAAGHPVAVAVKTVDGRPIKLEGNPDCPVGQGSADLRTQAALLDLYDPDRCTQGPQRRADGGFAPCSWSDLDQAVGTALARGRIGLLTGPVDGPARRALIDALVRAAGGRLTHAVFEALPRHAELAARAAAWGAAARPATCRPERARLLVAFGDLLGGGHAGLGEHVGFGALRRAGGQVVVVEPTLSQVGTCADLRVRCAADRLAWAAWGVAELAARALGAELPAAAGAALDLVRGADLAAALGLAPVGGRSPLAVIADRLVAEHRAGHPTLVYAGGASAGAELHLAAEFLNGLLGNRGVTVEDAAASALADDGAADGLLAACARGEIATLIVAGCNPVLAHPGAAAALAAVGTVLAIADRADETASLAHWIAPASHDLEAWGDAELRQGVYALQQPCVRPLWDVRDAEQSLLALAAAAGLPGFDAPTAKPAAAPPLSVISRKPLYVAEYAGARSWAAWVRGTWQDAVRATVRAAAEPAVFWTASLARGVVAAPSAPPAPAADAFRAAPQLAPFAAGGYQLVLSASRTLRDGAAANNPWLLETPDPVSKITWDNYLAMSPADAQRELIGQGAVVELQVDGHAIAVPVHVQDGQHPGTLELFLGWGRRRAGAVASLTDGFAIDAYPLYRRGAGAVQAAAIRATGRTYHLASTQFHDRIAGRPMPLDSESAAHELPARWAAGTDGEPGGRLSLWGSSHAYLGRRWGMAIDLDACTGCNACVVACTAENNIPVVGRDEVRKNREMHWIRIDRYYSGDAAGRLDVDVVHQPMLCQHCENAPCEVVCPANATMHNDQGVNIQIYNRCVGTRYCANNCPYKVRRFNWYEYSKYRAGPHGSGSPLARMARNLITEGSTSSAAELTHAPLELLLNPEVTVRSRGVMEKCNFCVQRLRRIRDHEHAANRPLPDGAITTACAQTCPAKAITFGDLNDPAAAVVRLGEREAARAFKALDEELNTRPQVGYLARQRRRLVPGGHGGHGGHEEGHA